MRNIKLLIEYDGKKYLGWQRLGNSDKTIQGKIETVLSKMTGEKTEIVGSGRTDAGTHARAQVANFKTKTELTATQILDFLNHQLPQDIVVKDVSECGERFHARYNAVGKKYTYYVWNNKIPNAFARNYSFHYEQNLDITKIEEACCKLIGEHDFLGFSSLKKSKKSTVRTIKDISVQMNGSMLELTFIGDGFLYNMVRIIVGTLLEIGAGKLQVSVIDEVFASRIRQNAGITVPAQGLFLDEVYYK